VLHVLSTYGAQREQIRDAETRDFQSQLVAQTTTATRRTESKIRAIVAEWIENRPLPYLAGCRFSGVSELFAGLRRHREFIGVVRPPCGSEACRAGSRRRFRGQRQAFRRGRAHAAPLRVVAAYAPRGHLALRDPAYRRPHGAGCIGCAARQHALADSIVARQDGPANIRTLQ
jgi:hypothetical protein